MNIDFSNEDVILYMLSEKKNSDNLQNIENEQVNNSMREIGNQNQIPRGFNVFLAYGISQNELRTLRLVYHLSYLNNNSGNIRNIDWSPQAIYQREENWLRSQINTNNIRNYNNMNNYRRNIVIRNPGINIIHVNHNNNWNGIRVRSYYRYEPNINFWQGFIFGLILNIFTLCILMISRPRPKFKIGLIFGMLLSICITFPFILDSK